MEFHRSRAFCGRAPISSTDVFTYDLTLGMASASCEPQRETGTHRAADRPAKRREEQFIPLEMKSGHGGLGSYAASGGSGLSDHAVGTLQQFGQFAVPLLKSLDPQP